MTMLLPDRLRTAINVIVGRFSRFVYHRPDWGFDSEHWRRQLCCGSGYEVDHIVALDQAWETGAVSWTREERRAFAADPRNLWCITRRQNREKSNDNLAEMSAATLALFTPAERKRIAQTSLAVKSRYGLSFGLGERDAIARLLAETRGIAAAQRDRCD